jgi:hypothetical protein
METIKEPMHPRRLEKNANITLKSALLPQAVFTWWRGAAPMAPITARTSSQCHKLRRFTYSFHLWAKEEARFVSSDLSAGKGENPALRPEKLHSPQA